MARVERIPTYLLILVVSGKEYLFIQGVGRILLARVGKNTYV